MDTRIPLLGIQPDFAGSLQNGLQARQLQQQVQQQGEMNALYRQQGPAIAQGQPGALNALAQFDPAASQQMQLGAVQIQGIKDQAKAAAQAAAAKMTAEQAAKVAAETEGFLRGAVPLYEAMKAGQAGAQQQLDAYLAAHKIPATSQNIETVLYASEGALEALQTYGKLNPAPVTPEFRAATPEEAGRYGAAAGQVNIKTGEFKPINPPSNGVTITNPDGTTTQIGGPAGKAPKPLTEAEGKNTGFLIRMQGAQAILNQTEMQGTDLMASIMANDPTGLANYAQTPEYQLYAQAKRDFVNAILRRESGAVISPQEFANAEQQYFPVPGDSREVIAQKRKNRENALAGVAVGSGAGVNNPVVAGSGAGGVAGSGEFATMDLPALTRVDVKSLTAEQAQALSDRLKELGF